MDFTKIKRIAAGILSAVTLCGVITSANYNSFENNVAIKANASSEVIIDTSFEDAADIESFTGRGGVEVFAQSTEYARTGTYSMSVTGREKSWNGPQFLMTGNSQPNTEYYVSAAVMTPWYGTVTLSWEYTDTEGERHYNNLGSAVSNGDWAVFEDIKFSYTDDMANVYIYIECSDANVSLYIDDFTVETAPIIPIQDDLVSLSDLYSPYFKIGTAIMTSNLSSPSFMALVEKHFDDSITAGNEMKPDSVLNQAKCIEAFEATGDDTNPPVSFGAARSMLNYCMEKNIPVRAHTLVWHSQTPDWFFKEGYATDGEWVSSEKMLARMENFIKNYFETLASDFPGLDVYACDVVNEAWLDGGVPRNPGEQGSSGSNNSAWVQVFGDNSFIEPAFTFARKYAPEGCKLYYNDFNEYMPQKTEAIVNMANDLKAKGVIDGIGCQSHLASNGGSDAFPSVSVYEKAISAFVATGLDVQITELDATITRDQPTEANLEAQAQYYSDIMDVLVKYADGISAVVFWGVTDDQSWRDWGYPLLFDDQFQAKPAYYSIIDGLELPDIPTDTTTTTTTTTTTEEVTTTTTEPVQPDTGSSEVTVSGVIESIDDEGNVVIDGVEYFFVTDSFKLIVESGAKVGDTITIVGYKKNSADVFERVSSVEVISADVVYGDADLDGEVKMNDVIKIMSHASNPTAYPLDDTAKNNCDVYQRGDGITLSDALSIQKKVAQMIDTLPES